MSSDHEKRERRNNAYKKHTRKVWVKNNSKKVCLLINLLEPLFNI